MKVNNLLSRIAAAYTTLLVGITPIAANAQEINQASYDAFKIANYVKNDGIEVSRGIMYEIFFESTDSFIRIVYRDMSPKGVDAGDTMSISPPLSLPFYRFNLDLSNVDPDRKQELEAILKEITAQITRQAIN